MNMTHKTTLTLALSAIDVPVTLAWIGNAAVT